MWNLSGVVYSSHLSESMSPEAAVDSAQVVTSAFYCTPLDAICVTTHEHNIVFYHRSGLKPFKQVLHVISLIFGTNTKCYFHVTL